MGGSGTPRGSIVQLCMYYVCISILYCPFIDYVEVGETKIDAAAAKNARGSFVGLRNALGVRFNQKSSGNLFYYYEKS